MEAEERKVGAHVVREEKSERCSTSSNRGGNDDSVALRFSSYHTIRVDQCHDDDFKKCNFRANTR